MSREEILDAVIAAITQVQSQSQRDVPPLRGDTRLVGDVPGCDSLVAVEIAITLTEILAPILGKREIPDSLFYGAGGQKCPTLDEITENVERFITQGKSPRARKKSSQTTTGKETALKPVPSNGCGHQANGSHSEKIAPLLEALKTEWFQTKPDASLMSDLDANKPDREHPKDASSHE
jgi:acyl carrier protein